MVPNSEVQTIVESNDYKDNNKLDFAKSSNEELNKVADGILGDAGNIEQVKLFPNKRESLNPDIKKRIASKLTSEIQDCINKLSDLWYNPEITEKETDQLTTLEYVIKNKDKIPKSWIMLEEKANKLAKSIGVEIQEKWILDDTKANPTQASTDNYKVAA